MRGIEPEFAAEIGARRARVEQARVEAERVWAAYRDWLLAGCFEHGRGSAVEVAKAAGISRARLYQLRRKYYDKMG